MQFRGFSHLNSSLTLAFRVSLLHFLLAIGSARIKLLLSSLSSLSILIHLISNIIKWLQKASLQFGESKWQRQASLQSCTCNEMGGILWWVVKDFDVKEYVGWGCLQTVRSWKRTMNINNTRFIYTTFFVGLWGSNVQIVCNLNDISGRNRSSSHLQRWAQRPNSIPTIAYIGRFNVHLLCCSTS